MSKTENKILKKFEATNVTIKIIDGVPMFELYSVGMALGYIAHGKNKDVPYKSRIDKTAKNAEITGCSQGVNTFITENQVYDFMFEANTKNASHLKNG